MTHQFKTVRLGRFLLDTLDIGIMELDHPAGFGADHVIVMLVTTIEFKHRVAAIEIVARDQACRLELRQHPVDRRQPDILARLDEVLVDIFRTEVTLLVAFQHLQDFHPRHSDLEPCLAQFLVLAAHVSAPSSVIDYRVLSPLAAASGIPIFMPIFPRPILVRRLWLPILLLAGLSACSFPGVYKLDIQQGNIITQDMVNELKPGMSKRQVRYIMGTPLLEDSFNDNRWDYFYSLKNSDDEYSQERLTVLFDNDRLVNLKGNFRPAQAAAGRTTAARTAAEPDMRSNEQKSNVQVYPIETPPTPEETPPQQ